MGAPYWPILACGTRMHVKTRYFENFKINISSYQLTCTVAREPTISLINWAAQSY
jgi:hypothetical protein